MIRRTGRRPLSVSLDPAVDAGRAAEIHEDHALYNRLRGGESEPVSCPCGCLPVVPSGSGRQRARGPVIPR
ncbi:hypothetical protein KSE_18290 [Kitasatospora setae KM-6054]|uniref:Uncharacterized protein n=1 Tax=Kitasatospora setae (strain ATCC 33774 / DSM 43861 / JCM 3304 / KCC A-0304 / NBRC 14216 / KM-6054) TaxID=452652 RepID=E4N8X3_KITSK|nr:hypothetical protein KSE_18290 [Kitasatospora setae KM-6054]